GRLEDISLGIETLITDDPGVAAQGAAELDALNRQRREIEDDMRQQAATDLESLQLQDDAKLPFGLCIYNREWHQGVIGILASRIKEGYHRPVIAFAASEPGWIKGSARSISGVHIRDILDSVAARHPGLISKFGGHAMAAGLTLREDGLAAFTTAFDQEVRRHLIADDIRGVVHSDGELLPEQMNLELAEMLRDGGPWGQYFPEPVFDGEFNLVNCRIVGEKHLKLVLSDKSNELLLDAIAFNQAEKMPQGGQQKLMAAYRLEVNEFRGNRSPQMNIEYLEWL
ncbi:MAG: single-stranded-DNA-specific exonuclease RecJ, partial [Gammaproteobacteria bacterium]|nr:single-stranded-DNA-specific exonuclease RecJ [Gammaproteobacteria bacterium]